MSQSNEQDVIGPCWVVYEPKEYAGTTVEEIVSIHSHERPVSARAGLIVRKWSRFAIRPWMVRRGLVVRERAVA